MGKEKLTTKAVSATVKEDVVFEVKKPEPYILIAKYTTFDREGYKNLNTCESKGDTLEVALNAIEFPKGLNALVNVTVKKGERSFTKALAPHTVRDVFDLKDHVLLQNCFRGY